MKRIFLIGRLRQLIVGIHGNRATVAATCNTIRLENHSHAKELLWLDKSIQTLATKIDVEPSTRMPKYDYRRSEIRHDVVILIYNEESSSSAHNNGTVRRAIYTHVDASKVYVYKRRGNVIASCTCLRQNSRRSTEESGHRG